eukprot:scaffold184_cov316-Pinguiococcus_pyrenoidosus.AAC.23
MSPRQMRKRICRPRKAHLEFPKRRRQIYLLKESLEHLRRASRVLLAFAAQNHHLATGVDERSGSQGVPQAQDGRRIALWGVFRVANAGGDGAQLHLVAQIGSGHHILDAQAHAHADLFSEIAHAGVR